MNRLEKKCFVTVAAAHGLLFGILIVGPGFFVPSEKTDPSKEITVYSPGDITKALTSGGTPEVVRANPLPPPPAPETKPVETIPKPPEIPPKPVVKPQPRDMEPEKTEVKIKPTPHGDEPTPPKKKPKVAELDPKDLVSSKPDLNKQKKQAEEMRRRQQAADDRRRQQELKEFGTAIKTLSKNLSGKTEIKFEPGAGGGGKAAVNYFDVVKSTLDAAWHPAETLGEDTPTASIAITISRDGTLRGRISKHSGNASMDRSVQNVLDTVTSVEPFPDSFKEQQLTATFTFDIKAKR